MLSISFNNTSFKVAFLIRESSLNQTEMKKFYLTGSWESKSIGVSLKYDKGKKPSSTCIKEYLTELLPQLANLYVDTLVCCDGEYFKTLCKVKTAEAHLGNVLDSVFLTGFKVIYAPNYQSIFAAPANQDKLDLALNTLSKHLEGTYEELGVNVLQNQIIPLDLRKELSKLHKYDEITLDTENFHLKHHSAGLGTVSISWDEHSALTFKVDAEAIEPTQVQVWDKKDKVYKTKIAHLKQVYNSKAREILREFLESYQGRVIYHNASYDVYILVYALYMKDLLDREGMLRGLEILVPQAECTYLMTYLCTNSCAGNTLGLKPNIREFAGNYAEDVTDIRLVKLEPLLKYNGIDSCGTYWLYKKMLPKLIEEKQDTLYRTKFLPYLTDILEMQLTGICLDMNRVDEVYEELTKIQEESLEVLHSSLLVQEFIYQSRLEEVIDRNSKYKTKVIGIDETKFKFNLNSNTQLQGLLYKTLGLPILDLTDTKQPATGRGTLKKLINHTDDEDIKSIIESIIKHSEAEKILSSFITSFKRDSVLCSDGYYRIYSSFHLGGTVSGRLSASNINFQQLPSGSVFGKLVKSCFIAPSGKVILSSDFSGLEDYVNTLLTRDPAKEVVLTRGFDGHSFRCYHFWSEKFPDINPDSPESINSLKKHLLRDKAKAPHFALQYQGTAATLEANCGFSKEESGKIEANYKKLYKVSYEWIAARIEGACKVGYGLGCYGLKIRAPLLHKVVVNSKHTPKEASAEMRTLGNALSGQSYGLINSDAGNRFNQLVRNSPYRNRISMWAMIHDAIYLQVDDDLEVIEWVNTNLIKCMCTYDDLPELQHDEIKLNSELDIHYPNWATAITLKNNMNQSQIEEVVKEYFSIK